MIVESFTQQNLGTVKPKLADVLQSADKVLLDKSGCSAGQGKASPV